MLALLRTSLDLSVTAGWFASHKLLLYSFVLQRLYESATAWSGTGRQVETTSTILLCLAGLLRLHLQQRDADTTLDSELSREVISLIRRLYYLDEEGFDSRLVAVIVLAKRLQMRKGSSSSPCVILIGRHSNTSH